MAKADRWYRQCKYKSVDPPLRVGVAWIPESLAKQGQIIYFGKKAELGEKRELWRVIEVWGREREAYLAEHAMAYKHQREQSDV